RGIKAARATQKWQVPTALAPHVDGRAALLHPQVAVFAYAVHRTAYSIEARDLTRARHSNRGCSASIGRRPELTTCRQRRYVVVVVRHRERDSSGRAGT